MRIDGYFIDFGGAGFKIANRMGALPKIRRQGYMTQEVRVVDRNNKRVAEFPVGAFARMAQGRYVSLPRGDLAATIFFRIEGKAETIFGDSIDHIDQTESAVHVTFKCGSARDFDLVVGAYGLHSHTRELVFEAESQFEKYLGYKVATLHDAEDSHKCSTLNRFKQRVSVNLPEEDHRD